MTEFDLKLADIDIVEIEKYLTDLAQGYCDSCGISSGCRTLIWDCMCSIIIHYKLAEDYSDATDIADEYIRQIDLDALQYDICFHRCEDYIWMKEVTVNEIGNKCQDAIEIGLRAMNQYIWKLFIDDIRTPPDDSFIIARNTDEAKRLIEEYGVPVLISFDHDLGMNENGDIIPNGYDFAKWLVEMDMDGIYKLSKNFDFMVHSQNPVGAENIRGYMNNYLETKL